MPEIEKKTEIQYIDLNIYKNEKSMFLVKVLFKLHEYFLETICYILICVAIKYDKE